MSAARGLRVWIVPILLVAVLVGWLITKKDPAESPASEEQVVEPAEQVEAAKEVSRRRYLVGYASAESTAQEDLMKIFDVVEAFQNTIKIPGALPTGENREIVQALLGDNPHRKVFIGEDFDYLNNDGELLDRWMNPIFFHFAEAADVGIRSAGPDGVMWNADDVVYGDHAGELE